MHDDLPITAGTDLDSLWNFQNLHLSEQRFRKYLQIVGDAGPLHAEALTQLARSLGLQRRYEEANACLADVDRISSQRAEVRYLLEQGRVLNGTNQGERSLALFIEAYETALAADEEVLAVDAAHMVAIVIPGHEEQLRWNEIALDLAVRSADPKAQKWRASLYNDIGWTYHDAGSYDKALELFAAAIPLRDAMGDATMARGARRCHACVLRSLERYEEALRIQIELEEAADASDHGYSQEEIGECQLALGHPEEARAAFALALHRFEATEAIEALEPERIARLRRLSETS